MAHSVCSLVVHHLLHDPVSQRETILMITKLVTVSMAHSVCSLVVHHLLHDPVSQRETILMITKLVTVSMAHSVRSLVVHHLLHYPVSQRETILMITKLVTASMAHSVRSLVVHHLLHDPVSQLETILMITKCIMVVVGMLIIIPFNEICKFISSNNTQVMQNAGRVNHLCNCVHSEQVNVPHLSESPFDMANGSLHDLPQRRHLVIV